MTSLPAKTGRPALLLHQARDGDPAPVDAYPAPRWKCDVCGYVTPADETPWECPGCDVGPDGSWSGTHEARDHFDELVDMRAVFDGP